MKKTKIICTIGLFSLSKEILGEMYRARINTAYGDINQYELIINNVLEVTDIPIKIDIKGPEIRLRMKGKIIEIHEIRELINLTI